MGIVWEAYHKGVLCSWGVPENPIDGILMTSSI